jgi:hypothetical protein
MNSYEVVITIIEGDEMESFMHTTKAFNTRQALNDALELIKLKEGPGVEIEIDICRGD